MCFIASEIKDRPAYIRRLFPDYPYGRPQLPEGRDVYSAVGALIIACSEDYMTDFQPLLIRGELVYGISQYGSNELLLVCDDDDLPLLEVEGKNLDPAPPGMRKAALLAKNINQAKIKEYGNDLAEIGADDFPPVMPSRLRNSALRWKLFSNYLIGRLWLKYIEKYIGLRPELIYYSDYRRRHSGEKGNDR